MPGRRRGGPIIAYARPDKHLEPDARNPTGRVVPGPFCWVEYPTGRAARDAVCHAYGKILVSQDLEVELDRQVLDGNYPGCRIDEEVFRGGFGMLDLAQLGNQDS